MARRAHIVDVDVFSSVMDSVQYNKRTGKLTINFLDGSRHSYTISKRQWREFMQAPSKGKYFNLYIRE